MIPIATPQFRTALLRKLGNVFPGHTVEFIPANRGLRFHLLDGNGAPVSDVVTFLRCDPARLTRAALLRAVRFRHIAPV